MTSDRFPTARKVWVARENTAQKTTRTTSGPTAGVAIARPSESVPRFKDGAAFGGDMALFATGIHQLGNLTGALAREASSLTSGLTPAILDAEFRVLRRQVRKRLVGNQLRASVNESARFLSSLDEIDNVIDAANSHFLGELHDRGRNLAVFYVLDSKSAAVNGCQNDVFLFSCFFDGRVGPFRRWFVNGVDDVDFRMSSQKVLHGRLALVQRAVRVLLSNDRRVAFFD